MTDDAATPSKLSFFALLALALGVFYVPFLSVPLEWFETFFHEISHGLAALATGGSLLRIELHLDGSGVCHTAAGSRFAIGFSGYAGAVIWGALLYLAASVSSHRVSTLLVAVLGAFVVVSGILWARDLVTLLVLGVILAFSALAYAAGRYRLTSAVVRFIALYVMLSAARTPLHLLDGRDIGDGEMLASATLVPEIAWVVVWEVIALAAIWLVYRSHGAMQAYPSSARRLGAA